MLFWTLFLPLTALFFAFYFYWINVLFKGKKTPYIIDQNYNRKPVKREFLFTLLSLVIFAAAGVVIQLLAARAFSFNIRRRPIRRPWFQRT